MVIQSGHFVDAAPILGLALILLGCCFHGVAIAVVWLVIQRTLNGPGAAVQHGWADKYNRHHLSRAKR